MTSDRPIGTDELRRAWRASTVAPEPARCPLPEELAALAVGGIDAARRAALAAHVAGCSDCALELRLARAVVHGDGDAAPAAAGARPVRAIGERRRFAGRTTAALLAAALAAVAVGGLALWRGAASAPRDGAGAVRGGEGTAAAGIEPSPGAVLAAPPGRLAWPAQPGASGYRVRLLDTEGGELWSSAVAGEAAAEPPAESLAGAGTYLWVVEVDGPVLRRRLGPYRFRIAEPPAP